MKKVKYALYVFGAIMVFSFVMVLYILHAAAADRQTIYNSPYVSFSPDGMAWTTNAGETDYTWYEEDKRVSTGIPSTLRALETGEHYYKVSRTGTIPIGYWKVAHEPASCVHDGYPPPGDYYYGIDYGTRSCGGYYYSGWTPYCADCGEMLVSMLFYMSEDSAESIDYLETEKEYYYLCPHCTNLEQGSGIKEHTCKAISWNRYMVKYDVNYMGKYGGYMEDSIHYYNNATEYEGDPVTPVTQLTKNAYTRIGYEFVEWNTKPDGSGISYADEAEILNLTTEDWQLQSGGNRGSVTLYAQWRPSRSTLRIDPAGGSYQGSSKIVSITEDYLSSYTVESDNVTAPAGHTVSFETNGGKVAALAGQTVFYDVGGRASITGTQHFVEWSRAVPFNGDLYGGVYSFIAPDGNIDTITATYAPDAILLPDAKKDGSSFGGWYYDREFQKPAGGPGDSFLPDTDVTLYAQWVDLTLVSKENYTVNGGKGAVDLSWSQSDNNNKTYLLYQSRDGEEWTQINSAEDIGSKLEASGDFSYTGSTESWTVPATGFYTLTAQGAQGGNYGEHAGGLGGSVTGRFWLQKGETITYTIGGQNGYNGGGAGSMYGNGGGCTVVTSDRKGTLLIAGGGGGATASGDGNAGGSAASVLETGINGQDGGAGGGGGYQGGAAGEYIVHHHTSLEDGETENDCYKIVSSGYTLLDQDSGYLSDWMNAYYNINSGEPFWPGKDGNPAITWDDVDMYSERWDAFGIYAHSTGESHLNYTLGCYYPYLSHPTWSDGYIPTYGNQKVEIKFHTNGWGPYVNPSYDYSWIAVYDQNQNAIYSATLNQLPFIYRESQNDSSWIEDDGSWHGSPSFDDRIFNVAIDIPEGTSSIYIDLHWSLGGGSDAWVSLNFMSVKFSKTETKTICGYTEGQIVSSKPAYGGSNYVNTDHCKDYTSGSGKKTENGSFSIKSGKLGYLENLELKGVLAPDMAAPERISLGTVEREPVGNDRVKVTWAAPADNGTDYYHMVESYQQGSENLLCRSNVTKDILVSGIRGYYYSVDGNSSGTVAVDPLHFLSDHGGKGGMTVTISQGVQYLHVAPVDVAGNVGETTDIRIDSQDVEWKLYTRQLEIEEAENVCPAVQDKTWYVRSDGETPFTLHYDAYIDGAAAAAYQINHMIFESRVEEALSKNVFTIPSEALQDGEISVPAGKVSYTAVDAPLLSRGPYTAVSRKERNRQLNAVQQFILSKEASGKKVLVTPAAGADHQGDTVYSALEADKGNSLTLIGDGEAPVINGLELLEDRGLIDRRNGTVTLYVTASDDLSGVRDFYLKVYNTDNAVEKTYTPEADGSIRLEITKDEPVFSGDFTVTAYAVDNVGNERTEKFSTTEFSLETKVERILSPHDPVFKCGESGILTITTWGYADRVEVEFPAEMAALDPSLDTVYSYTRTPRYRQEEQLQFMIPLYTPQNASYTITVRAYKGDKRLEDHPDLSVIEVNGTVLDEIRTRLR